MSRDERRQPFDGVVLDEDGKRIGVGSAAGTSPVAWQELPRFVADVSQLVWRVIRDKKVGRWQKVAAAAAIGYVVSPIDVLPDMLPGIGRLDDLVVIRQALRMLADSAGEDVLRRHWSGSEDGFAVVLRVAGLS